MSSIYANNKVAKPKTFTDVGVLKYLQHGQEHCSGSFGNPSSYFCNIIYLLFHFDNNLVVRHLPSGTGSNPDFQSSDGTIIQRVEN